MDRASGLLAIVLATAATGYAAEPETNRLKGVLASGAHFELTSTPLPNLYELSMPGTVLYLSADGRYLLRGRLIDLETGENLTNRVFVRQRLRAIEEVPEEEMIIFEADGETRHTITTFTDVDCPFCRKMHAEMDRLNANGIRVRYMLYPRAGLGSSSYDKAVSVWCAPDRQDAMTQAKLGAALEKRDCPNPVREHMVLGRWLGLDGTPYTITQTGRVIVGYMQSQKLVESLESDSRAQDR